MSSTVARYEAYPINPRVKIAALWTSMLFVFVYVDLFSMYRADIRADIEAGKIFAFSIGQGFLLGVTTYILGSVAEVALLAAVVDYAWTWPKATDTVTPPARRGTHTRAHVASKA